MTDVCGVCGASGRRDWVQKGRWTYRACSRCSAVGLSPLPEPGWADSFYDIGYFRGGGRDGYLDYTADEAQHRANGRRRIRWAQRYGAVAGSAWLDAGCAVGYTLDEARKEGYEVAGVELSEWAAGIAREQLKLCVKRSIPEALACRGSRFGVVSFFQVLEHLPDPMAALAEARASLQPGGLLVVETWDRGSAAARLFGRHWQQIAPPSVLWFFDRPSLKHMVESAGFSLLAIERSSKQITLGWAAGLMADKVPSALRGGLRMMASSPIGRWRVNYGLGDLVTLVAAAA